MVIFFRHLKLEIALAIPASNDEKKRPTIQQQKGWPCAADLCSCIFHSFEASNDAKNIYIYVKWTHPKFNYLINTAYLPQNIWSISVKFYLVSKLLMDVYEVPAAPWLTSKEIITWSWYIEQNKTTCPVFSGSEEITFRRSFPLRWF